MSNQKMSFHDGRIVTLHINDQQFVLESGTHMLFHYTVKYISNHNYEIPAIGVQVLSIEKFGKFYRDIRDGNITSLIGLISVSPTSTTFIAVERKWKFFLNQLMINVNESYSLKEGDVIILGDINCLVRINEVFPQIPQIAEDKELHNPKSPILKTKDKIRKHSISNLNNTMVNNDNESQDLLENYTSRLSEAAENDNVLDPIGDEQLSQTIFEKPTKTYVRKKSMKKCDVFNAPTQKMIVKEDISNAPTQIITAEENIFDMPTQKIELDEKNSKNDKAKKSSKTDKISELNIRQIFQDLTPSRSKSDSGHKYERSKSGDFLIPLIPKKNEKKIEKRNSTPQNENHYNSTQELENDLLTQVEQPKKSDNKYKKITMPTNDNLKSGFFETDLPKLPKERKKNLETSDSSSSESDEYMSDSPSIAYQRKVPLKSKNNNSSRKRKKSEITIEESLSKPFKKQLAVVLTKLDNMSSTTISSQKCIEREKNNQNKLSCDSPKISDDTKPKESLNENQTYKIMLSGLDLKKYIPIVNKLGGKIVTSDGEILVTEKVRCTFRFSISISSGIPIVSSSWLIESDKNGKFSDPQKFLLSEKGGKTNRNSDLDKLILSPKTFLKGWTVFLTPSILPSPRELEALIRCNGGSCVLETKPSKVHCTNLENAFTVSCNEDKEIYTKLPKPRVNADAIIKGVFDQYMSFDSFLLGE